MVSLNMSLPSLHASKNFLTEVESSCFVSLPLPIAVGFSHCLPSLTPFPSDPPPDSPAPSLSPLSLSPLFLSLDHINSKTNLFREYRCALTCTCSTTIYHFSQQVRPLQIKWAPLQARGIVMITNLRYLKSSMM